jgi:hypothetical protein
MHGRTGFGNREVPWWPAMTSIAGRIVTSKDVRQ